ncbi:unnamed protein product, partial [Rotaria sp. Silwood2]
LKKSVRPPEDESLRQKFSDHIKLSTSELPSKVDLRSHMTPVENQADIGS